MTPHYASAASVLTWPVAFCIFRNVLYGVERLWKR